jgi:hypothetical protein
MNFRYVVSVSLDEDSIEATCREDAVRKASEMLANGMYTIEIVDMEAPEYDPDDPDHERR